MKIVLTPDIIPEEANSSLDLQMEKLYYPQIWVATYEGISTCTITLLHVFLKFFNSRIFLCDCNTLQDSSKCDVAIRTFWSGLQSEWKGNWKLFLGIPAKIYGYMYWLHHEVKQLKLWKWHVLPFFWCHSVIL